MTGLAVARTGAWPCVLRQAAVVFCLAIALLASPARAAGPMLVHGLSMVGDEGRMRIILRFDREPSPEVFLLRGPHRLVLDFSDVQFAFSAEELEERGMLTGVHYGALEAGRARMIFAFDGPFSIERKAVEKAGADEWKFTADIVKATPAGFEAALAGNAQPVAPARATLKSDRLGVTPSPPKDRPGDRFTVVIDPGHGGIDGGADGPQGTKEKDLTLSFAKELRSKLEATGLFEVRMTRETDEFLRLDERVRIGRQYGADLFISIHADTIRYNHVRGATVYTLSEDASDEIAKAIAEKENLSDALAGVELKDEDAEVADILLDLVRRETQTFSIRFARGLVGELSKKVELIKNPHRSAGFRVLLAHDMPSVLLEMGYLSNKQDEALMRDPAWRDKAAESIVAAISIYAAARQGEDG